MRRQLFLMLLILMAGALPLCAQTTSPSTQPEVTEEELITLTFPDNVELKTLIEYVARRLDINILYDEQAINQRVTVKAPAKIPQRSLIYLLDSVLKLKGLALVDADAPGWKRIVPAANLVGAARPVTQPAEREGMRPSEAVTVVHILEHIDAARADQVVKPFLTQPGGNALAVSDSRILIVTDYASVVRRVGDLIRLIDQPQRPVEVKFVPVQHMDAAQLAPQVTQIVMAKIKSQSPEATATETIEVSHDPRTNKLVLIGTRSILDHAAAVAQSLDTPLDVITRVYSFRSASPDRIDRLAKELIGVSNAKRLYQSAVDNEGNLLIVTAPIAIHEKLEALQADVDIPVAQEQSPIQFYKLANATASDVLQTIAAIEGNASAETITSPEIPAPPADEPLIPGANRPPAAPGQAPPLPPIYQGEREERASTHARLPAPRPRTLKTAEATVTADINTNSIIVVAPPSVQRTYEHLIRTLDKRRPQVLIEATLITLDTSNNFTLGVELSRRWGNDHRVVTFSSFGLSEVGEGEDLGQLSLTPGIGFNGALITSDVADVVVRALRSSGRATVLSAPRILVNDNATGMLSSVAEAPFISTNASDTVATTSFAGYATAGTTITVTPHISDGDHLQLEYVVALNNFTGGGGNGTPPPRQTDSVQSEITIPDGHTVIVGGLNRKNRSQTKDALPILGRIPLLELLFSSRTTSDSTTTLFVFLRPVILRDDHFADLKYYSAREATAAGLSDDYPVSAPLAMP